MWFLYKLKRLQFPLTLPPQGARFSYKRLRFEFLGPNTITRRKWPIASPKQPSSIPPTPHSKKRLEPCVLFLKKWGPPGLALLALCLTLFALFFPRQTILPKNSSTKISKIQKEIAPEKIPITPAPQSSPAPVSEPIPNTPSTESLPKIQVRPVSKANGDALFQIRSLFGSGQEQNALNLALKIYNQEPFSTQGKQAASLAKGFHALMKKRGKLSQNPQTISIAAEEITQWLGYFDQEEQQLGLPSLWSQNHAEKLFTKWAEYFYQQRNLPQAFIFWQKASRWFPNHPKPQKGIQLLIQEGEQNYKKAYVLAPFAPLRARTLLEQTLSFIPSDHPLAQKITKAQTQLFSKAHLHSLETPLPLGQNKVPLNQ
jgi:hypothetical protein